jgi:hypothetical protein
VANTVELGRRTLTIILDIVGIAGMTNANPCVVTWNIHGLATGDLVSFQGITQANWTALNGNSYSITKLDANTFSIAVDASGFGAYVPGVDPGLIGQDFSAVAYGFPNGIRLSAVDWLSSLANDRLVVREDSGGGAIIYDKTDTGGGGLHQAVGGRSYHRKVYIKAADQMFSTPASVEIILEFD